MRVHAGGRIGGGLVTRTKRSAHGRQRLNGEGTISGLRKDGRVQRRGERPAPKNAFTAGALARASGRQTPSTACSRPERTAVTNSW